MTAAINLACETCWRDWNDSISEGACFRFSLEMLAQTGDPELLRLLAVRETILATAEALAAAPA